MAALTLLNETTLQVAWKDKHGDQETTLKVGDVFTIPIADKRHAIVLKELFPLQESKDILLIIEYLNELAMPLRFRKVLSVSGLSNIGVFVPMDLLKRRADEDDAPKKKQNTKP
jgi:hypothetical protein